MGDDDQKSGVPSSYVDALAECASDLWKGYEEELRRSRDAWDRENRRSSDERKNPE